MSAPDNAEAAGRIRPLEPPPADNADADVIEDDIERTRAELGDTVDQLAQKFDIKAQAGNQVQATKDAANERLQHAKVVANDRVRQARDVVTDDEGRPTPQVVIVAATVVAIVVALVLQRRRT